MTPTGLRGPVSTESVTLCSSALRRLSSLGTHSRALVRHNRHVQLVSRLPTGSRCLFNKGANVHSWSYFQFKF